MAFNAIFASISKRNNSTLIPSLSSGGTIAIELIDETSIQNPSIRLAPRANPQSWNYCYIQEFGRYYFVTEWISSNNQWIAKLKGDPLASFKTAILAHNEYVLRSASDYDGYITDTIYPAKASKICSILYGHQTFPSTYDATLTPFSPLKQNESYVVGIFGAFEASDFSSASSYADYVSRYTRGSITYYWMTTGQLVGIINYLCSNNQLANYGITDIGIGAQKALINPLQYIATIKAMPIPVPFPGTGVDVTSDIKYGWFKIAVRDMIPGTNAISFFDVSQLISGWLGVNLFSLDCYVDLRGIINAFGGLHPDADTRGQYLAKYPYTQIRCVYEPFGDFTIDTSILPYGTAGLKFDIDLEPLQGIGLLTVYPMVPIMGGYAPDRECLLARIESQIGIDIAVNQLSVNNLQTANAAIQSTLCTVTSLASGNVAGAISSMSSGIKDMIESQYPQNQTKGVNGTMFHRFVDGPVVYLETINIVGDDNDQLGRPLCQKRVLNTLSGYCMTRDADIAIAGATQSEIDEIKNYLNKGFYIE